jgi:hypothetical protein
MMQIMKRLLMALALVLVLSGNTLAAETSNQYKPRYNYQEKEYQLAPQQWKLQYNYMTKKYEFAPPNSRPVYNYQEKTYQMVPRRK